MITIRCSETGATLTIGRIDGDYWHAHLIASNLDAWSRVPSLMGESIATFFAEIARDWRGWPGNRTWESLEGDLSLRLSADGRGHVSVHVLLMLDMMHDTTVEMTLMVEAGQLDELARMVKAFVEN